jgi:hypothetical protein
MEETDEVLERINSIMAEHCINYAFAIIDEEGDLRYDYSNWRIGRMLFSDSLADMTQESIMSDIIWDDLEEDDDE